MQNISFFSSSNLIQGNYFFPCWLKFSHSTFSYFFTFLLSGCSSLLQESGFLLLLIFHRSSRLANILYTDSGNVACDLIYFAPFLDGSCDSESFKASFFSTFYKTRMPWSISLRLNYTISRTAKALKGLLLL